MVEAQEEQSSIAAGFRRLLGEVVITEIPERLIENLTIRYPNGADVTVSGHYLPHSIHIRSGNVLNLQGVLVDAENITLSINLSTLAEESKKVVDEIFTNAQKGDSDDNGVGN